MRAPKQLHVLALLSVLPGCRLVDNPYLPIADGSETATSTSTSTETETETGPEPIDTETETETDTETDTESTETETETGAEEFEYCPDVDMDGFGDGMSPECVTTTPDMAPMGSTINTFDCDDTDAQTFPGAAEEDDAGACMRDDDMDGWGDAAPPNPVTPGRDCDDLDPAAVVCVEVLGSCSQTTVDVSTQLGAIGSGGTGAYTYGWTPIETLSNPAIENPLAQPDVTTTYTVTAIDDFMPPHQGSAEATVHILDEPWIIAGDQTVCSTIGFDLVGDAVMFQSSPEGAQQCTVNAGVPTAVVCPVEGNEARVSIGLGVTGPSSDGFLGVVWGWQSSSQFYALIWKRGTEMFGNCTADQGVVVKRFDKVEDYGLEADFFCSTPSNNQTLLLGVGGTIATGWEFDHAYRVVLEQGDTGTHVEIHDDTLMSEVANFMVDDDIYPTGRVGLLFMSQPDACAGPVVSQCQ